jgi:aminoglycoside 6'-N-acetyltransferase
VNDIAFHPLSRDAFPLVSTWLAAPHVAPWWQEDASQNAIEARYGPFVDGDEPGEVFIVEWRGEPVGLIQRYRFADEPEWRAVMSVAGTPVDAAGVDYLIGNADLIGHGLGPAVISSFVAETWVSYPDVSAVVANVSAGNRRSWRALEKCGFRRVWTGELNSDDPGDAGINFVYVLCRPAPRTVLK